MTIEEMYSLLDENNSEENQAKGLEYAKTIKDLEIFIQPSFGKQSKMIWKNCALVLSRKSDEELEPYLVELLVWLQDLNWPGALLIMNRLSKYEKNNAFQMALSYCMNCIEKTNDEIWKEYLAELINNTNSYEFDEKGNLTKLISNVDLTIYEYDGSLIKITSNEEQI